MGGAAANVSDFLSFEDSTQRLRFAVADGARIAELSMVIITPSINLPRDNKGYYMYATYNLRFVNTLQHECKSCVEQAFLF